MISLEELVEEFQDLETPEERIQFLIELGNEMSEFPREFCTEEFRVLGCQSMVWLVPKWDGARFQFIAMSDAPMVHGLAAVLIATFSNKTPEEIVSTPVDSIFEGLHLKSFLSPLRSNGLNSMIQTIRRYASDKLSSPGTGHLAQSSEGSSGRGTQATNKSQGENEMGVLEKSLTALPLADRIDEIRKDFPVLDGRSTNGDLIAYLDNAASAQRPVQVIAGIDQLYREHYANVHRSGHQWAGATTEKLEGSREAVRRYIGADSLEEIIFTSGTTAAINLVAQSWGRHTLVEGDEILLTEMEHHSNIVPWQQLAIEKGVTIKWIPIDEDYRLDLRSLESLLTPKTKLLSFTAVSNVLGTVNPVTKLVAAARNVGAKVLVDAAQAVPHGPLDVKAWDADWVAFSGHKMLASSGVGVLYGKRTILEDMPAWLGGGNMIKLVTKEGFTQAGLPHRFEAGTPPIAEIISLKPAIEYLERVGASSIQEHEGVLRDRAIAGLRELEGIEIYSPSGGPKCGIVSFNVEGLHGDTIARVLDARGIAIRVGHHCAMPLHQRLGLPVSCRASFYLYNTHEEADRLVAGVAAAIKLKR